VFVVVDLMSTDQIARCVMQLLRAFGEFNQASAHTYNAWAAEITRRTRQAMVEGDIRGGLDPATIAETILGSMLGAELLANATTSGADVVARVTRAWTLLLPAIVSEESSSYFDEFLARESLRHSHPPLPD
jgi:hypothetical protein